MPSKYYFNDKEIVTIPGGIMNKIYKFFATGFGVGCIPGAPGTYGTVVGAGLYLLICDLPLFSYILFCAAFLFFSVWIISKALPQFSSEDPCPIVIDEMAGFFVTMIGLPFTWLNLGLGFVLFRFFDILKPPPIRTIDRNVKGAWGIVLDDIAAGILACITIWIIRIFVS